ncbi:MAG: LysR substrate-binding domain-containing protein [Bradyrhizobium sp.]|nr:LysR substrate-binding domain-containing protein [Bradyrhizobium sp.]
MANKPEHGDDHHGADTLDLRRLRYFIALAEELHFGRAADRLQIAQPPLSRLVGRIEADIGAQLIDRSRSQIRLTQAGKVLLARAREIIRQVDEATAEVAQLGSGKSGILRIGFVGSATHGFLPSLIKTFRGRHPDVELTLSAMNNAGLKEAIIRREIDGAIARPTIEDDEILSEKLHEEPLIVALPDAFEREWQHPLPLASLRDASFILYPQHPRPSFADHILSVCNAAGFRPHNPIMAMDYQTAVSLVSVGVGVCIVPRSVSATQHAGVIYRDFLGPNPGTSLSVNYRIDNRSPQLLGFVSVAREFARSLKPAALRLATDRSVSHVAKSAPKRLVGSLP